jgi:hypothetical protein
MDADKIASALKCYEKQLERSRKYYRKNNPNPNPVGRPKKIQASSSSSEISSSETSSSKLSK